MAMKTRIKLGFFLGNIDEQTHMDKNKGLKDLKTTKKNQKKWISAAKNKNEWSLAGSNC